MYSDETNTAFAYRKNSPTLYRESRTIIYTEAPIKNNTDAQRELSKHFIQPSISTNSFLYLDRMFSPLPP